MLKKKASVNWKKIITKFIWKTGCSRIAKITENGQKGMDRMDE
jgi:hypothetical protein